MLNFKTTLEQYRELFKTNIGYRLYCRSLLDSPNHGGKQVFHFAMALLLGGPGQSGAAQKAYLEDVLDNKASSYWVNPTNQFSKALGLDKDQVTALFDLKASLSVGEAFGAVKEKVDGTHEDDAKRLSNLEQQLAQLLVSTEKELLIDLIRKGECRQVILTGAPGTGKTFVAGEVAKAACADAARWGGMLENDRTGRKEAYTQVQFHPSYDYTDFMEGLRPVVTGGAKNNEIQFAKVDGSFKAFCRRVMAANEAYKKDFLADIQSAAETFAATLSADTYAEQIKALRGKFPAGSPAQSSLDTIKALLDAASVCPALEAQTEALDSPLPAADSVALLAKAAVKLPGKHLPAELQNTAHQFKTQARTLAELLKETAEDGQDGPHLLILQAMNETISALEQYLRNKSDAHLELLKKAVLDLFMEKLKDVRNNTLSNKFGCDVESLAFWRLPNQKQYLDRWTLKVADKHSPSMLEALKQSHPVFRLRELLTQLCETNYVAAAQQEAEALVSRLRETSDAEYTGSPSYPLYFFIVDEINRANLSKVFGELMYCLEKDKRGKKIPTQYQNLPTCNANGEELKDDIFADGFCVPENVVIIGTMNDIDRSVDSMDFALRRRFEWREIVVSDYGLLTAFLSDHYGSVISENAYPLTRCIRNLNEYLDQEGAEYDLNRQYHISQGQFANLPRHLSTLTDILEYVWNYRIESLLREYLRGEPENKLEAFIGATAPNRNYDAYTGACKALFSGLKEPDKDAELSDADGALSGENTRTPEA